jgi:hypothetical protein
MTDTPSIKIRGADGRFQIGAKNPSGIVAGTKSAKARSRASASNGKLFAPSSIDCRTINARRFRDIIKKYTQELGVKELTQVQETALRNVAFITITMEAMEKTVASGGRVNAKEYARLSNDLSRRLRDIGLVAQYGPVTSKTNDDAANSPNKSLVEYLHGARTS